MAESELTLHDLASQILAFRELLDQMRRVHAGASMDRACIDALTGGGSGPAAYALDDIRRAPLADPASTCAASAMAAIPATSRTSRRPASSRADVR